jgi:spermidine/putrescine transport system permease protein
VRKRSFGALLAVPAWIWLLFFFVVPVGLIVYYSFGYKPGLFGTHANDKMSLDRYAEVLTPTFFTTFQNTLWIGLAGTALCFIIGAPVAYWMATKAAPSKRGLLVALVMVPFWTNFLVRTIGWQVILSPDGWISTVLKWVGLGPLDILYTRPAVLLGVVYNYLPLMILPLFVAFDRVHGSLREASKDLGAGRWTTFLRITLPLASPGVLAGVMLVFIPLMGDYITATVLGGAKGNMIGQLVASQFQTAQNWALGSAMAVMLILIVMLTVAVGIGVVWLVRVPVRAHYRVTLPPEDGGAAPAPVTRTAEQQPQEVPA